MSAIVDAAVGAFRFFYHYDHMNAAVHTADVRFSPITFRLAEALSLYDSNLAANPMVKEVLAHKGQYEEDTGR